MFYSAEHHCLVYPADPRLLQLEGARKINGQYVSVPAALENLQGLHRLSLPVVSPLEIANYDWPIRAPWKPLAHMQITAGFLALNPRAFCFNDMGTMKTLSALWAADYLMEEASETLRAIIIAPLSILRPVWGKHIFDHFAGRRTYRILHGDHEKRRRELDKPSDFYIINPDGLTCGVPTDPRKALYGLAADVAERSDIRIAIIDEASAYRSVGTRRHRAARSVLGVRPYLWQLTGTPTPNGPIDALGLGRLAGVTNESERSWKGRTMIHVSQWKWVPRADAAELVAKLLSPSIRFPSTVVNLPFALPPEQRDVELSPEQAHAWKTLKKEAVLAMRSGELVHAVNEAALRIKLIQVAAGCVYDSSHASHDLNPGPRLAEVTSIIEETDRKVVIFAPLTNVLNMLYRHLCAPKGKYQGAIINGQVSPRDRGEILRRFGLPSDPLRICLADPACTSHGINEFVTASVCIWYAPTDKNELYRQGIKRLDRPGQTGPVKIIQLVSTKLEKEIYERLERNESMQGLILKFAEER